MSEIVFAPPGPDEPGYLRRQRSVLQFKQRLESADGVPPVELIDDLVAFLAAFVKEPVEPEAKIKALLDASERQFIELLGLLSGESSKNSLAGRSRRRCASTSRGSRSTTCRSGRSRSTRRAATRSGRRRSKSR